MNKKDFGNNYMRDWKIIVLVFAGGLVLLSVFAWQIYLSNQIAGGFLSLTEEVPAVPIRTISEKRLRADLEILQNRQTDFSKNKNNPVKLIDPVL